jgi:hypothetical protein
MFARKPLLTIAAVAAGAVAGTAGAAIAQNAPAPTTIEVQAATQLSAGATAPFDAPGVRAIRRGRAIPAGYVLVGRRVTINTGAQEAWAAARFTCPSGKVLRTFGISGRVGAQPGGAEYVGRRTFMVIMDAPRGPGTKTGTVYAVCR